MVCARREAGLRACRFHERPHHWNVGTSAARFVGGGALSKPYAVAEARAGAVAGRSQTARGGDHAVMTVVT